MCKIIFLGSGGGRFNLIKQLRSNGGFLIKTSNLFISVDPGPGALTQFNKLGLDPTKLDGLIITHNHIDHYLEAPLLIEAMTDYARKEKGFLIGSSSVVEGKESPTSSYDPILSSYHLSKIKQKIVLYPNQKRIIELKEKNLSFEIQGVPTKHEDQSGVGFVLNLDKYKLAYTSDTEFLEEQIKFFKEVDVLIANCLKQQKDKVPGHLSADSLIELLVQAKPKVCIITHLGLRLILEGPAKVAGEIQKQSNVKTLAAADSYFYDLKTSTFAKFSKKQKDKQQKLL
ncbi:MAG: MBL fold metallo-hydrolase [Candidatus Micrarchaeota archaeon]|nr:MBL fold metallo-hydrolase [Candidatus Micrarchaeota archaeon]